MAEIRWLNKCGFRCKNNGVKWLTTLDMCWSSGLMGFKDKLMDNGTH